MKLGWSSVDRLVTTLAQQLTIAVTGGSSPGYAGRSYPLPSPSPGAHPSGFLPSSSNGRTSEIFLSIAYNSNKLK